MLNVNVQTLEGITIIQCQGRIVAGEESAVLWRVAVSLADTRMLMLDLGQVDCIDAGGLGLLLRLLAWSRCKGIHLSLADLTPRVQHLFKLTRLDQVFEIRSRGEVFDLPLRGTNLDRGAMGIQKPQS